MGSQSSAICSTEPHEKVKYGLTMFDALIDGLVLVLQWKAFSLMMVGMGLGFIVGCSPASAAPRRSL